MERKESLASWLDLPILSFVYDTFFFLLLTRQVLPSNRAIYELYCIALARLIVTDEFALLKKLHPRYAPYSKKKTDRNGRICRACPARRGREKKSKG